MTAWPTGWAYGCSVSSGSTAPSSRRLRSRQARTLLRRLALERGGTVAADSLIEAVWPSARPAKPERDLHVLVSRARAVVGRRPACGDGRRLRAAGRLVGRRRSSSR